jgi:hypothetical protein
MRAEVAMRSFSLSVALALVTACGGSPMAPAQEPAPATQTPASPADGKPATAEIGAAAPAPAPVTAPSAAPAQAPAAGGAAKAEAAKPAAKPSKITARHVLIQWMGCERTAPSVVRTREQAHSVALDVLARAKAGEDFARLAVEFSDEPNAGARGGSLGRFGHGQMVKAFEDAAFALAPGEISDIVESSFGFHVIQRLE